MYNWWVENSWKACSVEEIKKQVIEFNQKLQNFISQRQESDRNAIHNEIAPLQNYISSLSHKQDELLKVIGSKRIEVSLQRFDSWFWNYQKIQLFRWIILEWAFPIFLGACALGLTWQWIFS